MYHVPFRDIGRFKSFGKSHIYFRHRSLFRYLYQYMNYQILFYYHIATQEYPHHLYQTSQYSYQCYYRVITLHSMSPREFHSYGRRPVKHYSTIYLCPMAAVL